MEPQTPSLSPKRSFSDDYSSNVDTSRPFRSVKEAVAVFGERLLITGELYSPKPYPATVSHDTPSYNDQETPWRSAYSSSPSTKTPKEGSTTDEDDVTKSRPGFEVFDTLKKLEAELEETKIELKRLKERESELEIALATLNAELHKNMSKLAEAEAEAAAAKKLAVVTRATSYGMGKGEEIAREEAKRRELMKRMEENNQTLAEILSISGEKEAYFGGSKREKKVGMKKKPIIPLMGDLFFFRKKNSSNADLHSIYDSHTVYFN